MQVKNVLLDLQVQNKSSSSTTDIPREGGLDFSQNIPEDSRYFVSHFRSSQEAYSFGLKLSKRRDLVTNNIF